jgi:hypothetical protein
MLKIKRVLIQAMKRIAEGKKYVYVQKPILERSGGGKSYIPLPLPPGENNLEEAQGFSCGLI